MNLKEKTGCQQPNEFSLVHRVVRLLRLAILIALVSILQKLIEHRSIITKTKLIASIFFFLGKSEIITRVLHLTANNGSFDVHVKKKITLGAKAKK